MNYDNVLTIDLETSVKNKGEEAIGKNAASPFCKENDVVAYGWKWSNTPIQTLYRDRPISLFQPFVKDRLDCVVGHNIKFDLLYLLERDFPGVREWFNGPDFIWDTQLAEYILSGQTQHYPSLDYCAEKRGGTLKDDRIKEYWENGIDTEDIPKDQLLEYLEHDVDNTDIVFKSQLVEAEERGMLPLMYTQMRALKATIEMEYNGMAFDVLRAHDEETRLMVRLGEEVEELKYTMSTLMPDMKPSNINPSSNDQISVCLFGGEYKETVVVEMVDEDGRNIVYKSGPRKGESRQKNEERTYHTGGLGVAKKWGELTKKPGIFKTDEKLLKTLKHEYLGAIYTFCHILLNIRKLSKDINTYYKGYTALTWPDGRIHGQLNHCSTATGRLSSSSPNLQNLSNE